MSLRPMTAERIAKMVVEDESLFILDVRSEEAYEDWNIEGLRTDSRNVPYATFQEAIDETIDQLPKDRPILVVCAKEKTSILVGEELAARSIDVCYLEGGMQAWSEQLVPIFIGTTKSVDVYQWIRIGKGCLSYMLVGETEAVVIDAARMIDVYTNFAKEQGVRISHVVDSHLHADHITGGPMLAQQTDARYYMMRSEGAVFPLEPLEEHESIPFDDSTLRVIALKTPGHTPGSVSFLLNDTYLFSGDTVFVSGLGRPDLGNRVDEWANDLYETVHRSIVPMTEDVLVLPGHYANYVEERNERGFVGKTLGDIRRENEAMFTASKEEFLRQVRQSASSVKPPNFEEIVALNRGETEASLEEIRTLEIGPNRCAVHHSTCDQ